MAALSIRIDENLRKGAEQAFASMGLSLADGVRSYLNYVNVERKIPFSPVSDPMYAHNNSGHIPNEETEAAIKNIDEGKNLHEVSWDEFRALLHSPIADDE